MTSDKRDDDLVIIAPDLREALGWGMKGDIIEVPGEDGEVIRYLIPPVHNDSLAGALARYVKRPMSEDEWPEARERAWRDAVRWEDEPLP